MKRHIPFIIVGLIVLGVFMQGDKQANMKKTAGADYVQFIADKDNYLAGSMDFSQFVTSGNNWVDYVEIPIGGCVNYASPDGGTFQSLSFGNSQTFLAQTFTVPNSDGMYLTEINIRGSRKIWSKNFVRFEITTGLDNEAIWSQDVDYSYINSGSSPLYPWSNIIVTNPILLEKNMQYFLRVSAPTSNAGDYQWQKVLEVWGEQAWRKDSYTGYAWQSIESFIFDLKFCHNGGT